VVDGFKSLRNVTINIKPLTVLIGLNSSGKSSILQLFQVLKQSVLQGGNRLIANGSLVNLGSFADIASKAKRKKEIQVQISGMRTQHLNPPFSRVTRYNYLMKIDANGLHYHQSSIRSGDFVVKGVYEREVDPKRMEIPVHEGSLLLAPQTRIGHPFQFAGSTGDLGDFHHNIFQQQFLEVIAQDLSGFFLVPAIRGISSPSYPLDTRASTDLTDVLDLNKQAIKFASTVVYESPAMERKINEWISRITGINIRARTVPDKRASIEAFRRYNVNIINEGFGTNQLVHLFAQIAKAPSGSLVGIEEPEVHLHPKAQSELAKVLSEIAKKERKNLILTTHGEHILYRLLIEVAKGNLKREDLAIYHFRLSTKGVTSVKRLMPDEKGRLDKGIPDFLEKDLEEFKDFLDALKVK